MNTTIDTTCAGVFYDNGGSAGNYSNSQNLTQTFVSANGNRLQFSFSSFITQSGSDVLYVYDGPASSYPLIGVYSGSSSPGVIESTGDAITFRFSSSSSTNYAGWEANISCTTPALPTYGMTNNAVDTVCTAVFYDSGGGGANYSDNENRIHTFCSATGDFLHFEFTRNDIFLSSGDTLFVHDGSDETSPLLAYYISNAEVEPLSSSGTCLTFRFVSGSSVTTSGWQANIMCTSTPAPSPQINMSAGARGVCSGVFRDDGGTSNYSSSQNVYQTFYSYNGNRIQFDFTSFDIETNDDDLYIYDGPNSTYPLIGVYTGTNSPGLVTSSGNSLTFRFYADNFTTRSGWEANISCAGPVLPVINMASDTVSTCESVWYDPSGPALNYLDNEYEVQTICADSGYLQVDFANTHTSLASGDTLWIYDGDNTNAPPLAMFLSGAAFETFTSSANCLTFEFISNSSSNSRGWQAYLNCTPVPAGAGSYNMSNEHVYVCDGVFRDNGGTSNYSSSQNVYQTFHSYNGERIQFDFTSFDIETNDDDFYIYDGPDASYPLIGAYTGTNSPGLVTSSGSALTFRFYADNFTTRSGWEANISCAGEVLPAYEMSAGIDTICGAVFYDDGGANGSYGDDVHLIQTFCADSGYLEANFNTAHSALTSGDTLWVYDGIDTNSPPLAMFISSSNFETFSSSASCLTFEFTSNSSSNTRGWQTFLNCVASPISPTYFDMSAGARYVCSGTFRDNGGSSNYSSSQSRTQTFHSYNGNRIQADFTAFNTESNYDYMRIYDGPNSSYPQIGQWTSTASPGTILATGSALTFYFYADGSSTRSGWEADLSCEGAVLPIYEMTDAAQDTVCEAVFYDAGGANGNYADDEHLVHTFCADTGFLQVSFNNTHASFGSGDTLWVYDGEDTNAPPFAMFIAGSELESFTSSSSCLSFEFISNSSSTSRGWQAYFNCTPTAPTTPTYFDMSSGARYVCDGIFRDNGGSSNYSSSQNRTQTFYSYNGNRIQLDFTAFNTESNYDYMRIYDGPSTAYPQLGYWTSTGSPGSILSSGNSLTVTFYADGSSTRSGWQADISCQSPVLPVFNMESATDTICEAAFYDHNGADANYPDNESRIHSFCSDSSLLQFEFNRVHFSLASGDTLWVYDGADTSANPIGAYTSGSRVETITSSSNCLSFYFQSNTSGTSRGWQALASCVDTLPPPQDFYMSSGIRYVCEGRFVDMGGPSGNYSSSQNQSMSFRSSAGQRLSFSFTSFNLETNYDRLYVYDGPSTSSPLIGNFTGTSSPGVISSTEDVLTFRFYSDGSSTRSGWIADISCIEIPMPDLSYNGPVCEGDSLLLSAFVSDSNANFEWFGPDSFSSNLANPIIPQAALSNEGIYGAITIIEGNPSDTAFMYVDIVPYPTIPTISSNSPICGGDTLFISLEVDPNLNFVWTGPSGYISTNPDIIIPNLNVLTSGNYQITVIDSNGCRNSEIVPGVLNDIAAHAGGDTLMLMPGGVTLGGTNTATGGVAPYAYAWSPPMGLSSSFAAHPIANPSQTMTYSLTVRDATGCEATDEVVVLLECGKDVFEPNNMAIESAILPDVGVNRNATICAANDEDWFTFVADAENLNILLHQLPADYDLDLYDAALTLVASSQNPSRQDEQILWNGAMIGERYFVKVYGFGGMWSAESYSLRLHTRDIPFVGATVKDGNDKGENESLNSLQSIQLYPNPSRDLVKVRMEGIAGEVKFRLRHATGQLIRDVSWQIEGEATQTLDLSGLAEGVYFYEIEYEGGRSSGKLVKME